ncbi:MAG: L-aspartate oxidase [Saprospiraceae bacterium]|jgi:L-aspartate oxidase
MFFTHLILGTFSLFNFDEMKTNQPLKTDFLVIGSGIAGLVFALKSAEKGSVCMVTKDSPQESNTTYAQGGIAGVWNLESDDHSKHIQDTVIAGIGLNDREVVERVIGEAKQRINELIEWGTNFDKDASDHYDLAMEGGHSESRILHHKDITGREIIRALYDQVKKHPNIKVLDYHFAVDLITQHHFGIHITRKNDDITCFGAYILDKKSGKVFQLLAKKTIMATGGIGLVYNSTTNPEVATGDGIAMAYRAKALVKDMEFIQFHPTALFNPGASPAFLVSEAVRGFGAVLKNKNGEEFMQVYDKRGSLAPRDIVARAIDSEMKKHGLDHVYLDCTHLNIKEFKAHFPNIYSKCLTLGIDPAFQFIPVTPSAHYCCGGIDVDEHGRSSVENLYAIGECSRTGLHGANRLASNSLLEALVYAHTASEHAVENFNDSSIKEGVPEWDTSGTEAPEEMILITQSLKEVQELMSAYVGIVRSDLRLTRALERLKIIYQETEDLYEKTTLSQTICETRNIINVAYLIIKTASERKESVGLHYRVD